MNTALTWIRERLVLVVVVVVTALLLISWFTWSTMAAQKRAAAVGRVATGLAGARAASAGEAAQILDGAHAAATASDQLTRENADAIQAAPGADLRLDPALNRTGRSRLCERPAYRGRAECVHEPDRPKPSR